MECVSAPRPARRLRIRCKTASRAAQAAAAARSLHRRTHTARKSPFRCAPAPPASPSGPAALPLPHVFPPARSSAAGRRGALGASVAHRSTWASSKSSSRTAIQEGCPKGSDRGRRWERAPPRRSIARDLRETGRPRASLALRWANGPRSAAAAFGWFGACTMRRGSSPGENVRVANEGVIVGERIEGAPAARFVNRKRSGRQSSCLLGEELMKRILVGVDGSKESRDAVKLAAELARADGSLLVVASVILPVSPLEGAPEIVARAKAQQARDREEAKALVQEAAASIGSGVKVETAIAEGSPAIALADLAREGDVQLVVVGHRGRNAVARALLGSVADRLVQISAKPVLVVR